MSEGGETLIAGRYRLEHQIGSGAMGVVWRAVDVRLDRPVAVKQLLLPPGLNATETEKARQRAFREGRIAARLQHPNAISVYNVADHEGHPVLVMEYLPSRSLSDLLDERGVLPPPDAARIGAQVAAALVNAHEAGVIHRDVKPGNILIADDGTAKITDFGISRAAGDITVTSTGLLAGTPAFLSPETARGAEPGPAADVFSLGATLYAAVEGRPPFENPGNEIAMLHVVATGNIIPPRQAGALDGALRAMLNSEPQTRPTMAQAETALRAVAEARPGALDAPTLPPGAVRASTRVDLNPAAVSAIPSPPPQQTGPATPTSLPTPQQRPNPPATGGQPVVRPAATPMGGAAGAGPQGWSRARLATTAIAALAAAAVGILVAELLVGGSDRPEDSTAETNASGTGASVSVAAPSSPAPTTDSPSPGTTTVVSSSPPPPTSQTLSPAELEKTVTEYYALMPHDVEQGWRMLGPGLRAQGRDSYRDFWADIEAVDIVGGPTAVSGHIVEVELEFTTEDSVVREKHQLGMVVRDGRALIDTDTVLTITELGEPDEEEPDEETEEGEEG